MRAEFDIYQLFSRFSLRLLIDTSRYWFTTLISFRAAFTPATALAARRLTRHFFISSRRSRRLSSPPPATVFLFTLSPVFTPPAGFQRIVIFISELEYLLIFSASDISSIE